MILFSFFCLCVASSRVEQFRPYSDSTETNFSEAPEVGQRLGAGRTSAAVHWDTNDDLSRQRNIDVPRLYLNSPPPATRRPEGHLKTICYPNLNGLSVISFGWIFQGSICLNLHALLFCRSSPLSFCISPSRSGRSVRGGAPPLCTPPSAVLHRPG